MSNNKSDSKVIYILIKSNGDGSGVNKFVEDKRVIDVLNQAYLDGLIGCEVPGVDGDGFNYNEIYVPKDWSENDLGVRFYTLEDLKDCFEDNGNSDNLMEIYNSIAN